MVIDFLSTNNYISFNYKLAHIIGLNSAIYVAELLNIYEKAIRKDKVTDGFFTIDRKYIQERTTFTTAEQKELDAILENIGLIMKDGANTVSICVECLTTLLIDSNEKLISNVENIIKKTSKSKKTKQETIIENLKAHIECDNDELKKAYEGWIDGVYANPKGFLSNRAIEIFQETVDNFANHNLDLALTIIDIASVNGYRDANWAINLYNRNISAYNNHNSINKTVSVGSEVF